VTVPESARGEGRREIEQLLENLISNAVKYTPRGGRVGMTFWCAHQGAVRIVVSDNGIGIPKKELSGLFTEFHRASNAQEFIGTGLGLAIVKEIVDKLNGKIEVESEQGLGTTFIVHLPVFLNEAFHGETVMRNGNGNHRFINEREIEGHLEDAVRSRGDLAREVIAKARELKGLDSMDAATLLQCHDPAVLEEMFHTAREVKEAIYGNRLVLFAPLYISNLCQNDCQYCAFRVRNKNIQRRALSQEEIGKEARYLVRTGQTNSSGQARLSQSGFDYIWFDSNHLRSREKRRSGVSV
jgi:anti-sigma regulatory factor (Ser/Thr protein kinase)